MKPVLKKDIVISENYNKVKYDNLMSSSPKIEKKNDRNTQKGNYDLLTQFFRNSKTSIPDTNTILSALSHDLRSPLNSIIGFSEILLSQRLGKLKSDQKKQLSIILRRGSELLSIIDNLVEYCRLIRNDLSIHLATFALNPFLNATVERLKHTIPPGGPKLVYLPPKGVYRVVGEEQKFTLVLSQVLQAGILIFHPREIRVDVDEADPKDSQESDVVKTRMVFLCRGKFNPQVLFDWNEPGDIPGKVKFGLLLARLYVTFMGGILSVSQKKGRMEFYFSLNREKK